MPKPNLEVLLILSAWSDFIREGSGFCVQCGAVQPDDDGTCCICGATCTGRALTEHAGNVRDALRYAQEAVEEERERLIKAAVPLVVSICGAWTDERILQAARAAFAPLSTTETKE